MLPFEKAELLKHFNDGKHHAVTTVNVLLFLQRKGLLALDDTKKDGR